MPLGLRAREPDERSVREILKPLVRKKGILRRRPAERLAFRRLAYLPYDLVSFSYSLADGARGSGQVAINLLIAAHAEEPRDLVLSLRQSHASRCASALELSDIAPALEPRVRGMDVLKRLAEIRTEIEELRRALGPLLADARSSMVSLAWGWSSIIGLGPVAAARKEIAYADAYAKAEAVAKGMNLRLGLSEGAVIASLEPLRQEGPIYLPVLVVGLEGPSGRRLAILDLSGPEPELDVDLTRLCAHKPGLRRELEELVQA